MWHPIGGRLGQLPREGGWPFLPPASSVQPPLSAAPGRAGVWGNSSLAGSSKQDTSLETEPFKLCGKGDCRCCGLTWWLLPWEQRSSPLPGTTSPLDSRGAAMSALTAPHVGSEKQITQGYTWIPAPPQKSHHSVASGRFISQSAPPP